LIIWRELDSDHAMNRNFTVWNLRGSNADMFQEMLEVLNATLVFALFFASRVVPAVFLKVTLFAGSNNALGDLVTNRASPLRKFFREAIKGSLG
jgi:hypothetical protein